MAIKLKLFYNMSIVCTSNYIGPYNDCFIPNLMQIALALVIFSWSKK